MASNSARVFAPLNLCPKPKVAESGRVTVPLAVPFLTPGLESRVGIHSMLNLCAVEQRGGGVFVKVIHQGEDTADSDAGTVELHPEHHQFGVFSMTSRS